MEHLQGRLDEAGGGAEQDSRYDAVERGLAHRIAPASRHVEDHAHGSQNAECDRPLIVRRVFIAARRIAEDRVHRQPEDDHGGADDLAEADFLRGQEVAERKGEHDRRHEQRLDDREPPVIEGDRLHDVTDEQRARAYEPPRAGRKLGEGAKAVRRQPERQRALLLKRGGDGEQQSRDECEDLGQNRDSTTTCDSIRAWLTTRATSPDRAGVVLVSLILVAAVANLNLSVANVALPDIALDFDAGQVSLNLIAVGYSLGLAASVLYFGAIGDRYGRKLMLLLGTMLAVPMSLLAAFAPSDEVLFVARVGGGLAAGMAYPTTLALIAALWSGPGRTKSIALWSAIGGAIAALGPLISGALLEQFDWGSVFLITLPLAVVAILMAYLFVPGNVNETAEPVDNLGGVLSLVMVGALIISINFAPVPNETTLVLVLGGVALAAAVGFYLRQRRARNPLYDLDVAARRVFWVAACAGIIVFGSLMAAAFVSQQYLQNVLGYSTLEAGASILPAALLMVIVAPRSAKLVEARGARFTLLCGYVFLAAGVPFHAPALEGGHRLLEDRDRVRLHRSRSRLCGNAGVSLAHGLSAGHASRHGLGHGRPPA